MVILFELLSIISLVFGIFSLSQATLGVGLIGVACLFGIFARLYQAKSYQNEIIAILEQVKYLSDSSYKNYSALKGLEQFIKNPQNKDISVPFQNQIDESHYQTGDSLKSNKVCPKCGKLMEIKIAQKGDDRGKRFYVCSDYPKCQEVVPL